MSLYNGDGVAQDASLRAYDLNIMAEPEFAPGHDQRTRYRQYVYGLTLDVGCVQTVWQCERCILSVHIWPLPTEGKWSESELD
jgi:hypothetical protein